jgi:hypothetical protein
MFLSLLSSLGQLWRGGEPVDKKTTLTVLLLLRLLLLRLRLLHRCVPVLSLCVCIQSYQAPLPAPSLGQPLQGALRLTVRCVLWPTVHPPTWAPSSIHCLLLPPRASPKSTDW